MLKNLSAAIFDPQHHKSGHDYRQNDAGRYALVRFVWELWIFKVGKYKVGSVIPGLTEKILWGSNFENYIMLYWL